MNGTDARGDVDWILPDLPAHTQILLRHEMARPTSDKDGEGLVFPFPASKFLVDAHRFDSVTSTFTKWSRRSGHHLPKVRLPFFLPDQFTTDLCILLTSRQQRNCPPQIRSFYEARLSPLPMEVPMSFAPAHRAGHFPSPVVESQEVGSGSLGRVESR